MGMMERCEAERQWRGGEGNASDGGWWRRGVWVWGMMERFRGSLRSGGR